MIVVIPARWASTRFPGKVLAPLGGRPLVLRVCDVAARAARVERVIVATDDERVLLAVQRAGFEAEITRPDHASGTDRVAEIADRARAAVVLGVQADEPFLEPADLDALAEAALAGVPGGPGPDVLSTLATPLSGRGAWLDPHTVKVVVDAGGRALYFSRAPIPYLRAPSGGLRQPPDGDPPACARQHVGVYAWRADALAGFRRLPLSPLEQAEGLEQLRALEAGWTIRVLPARGTPFGIDTPEDLKLAEQRLLSRGDTT